MNWSILIIIAIGIIVIVLVFTLPEKTSTRSGKAGYSCGSNGCKPSMGGEHVTMTDCQNRCRSYVKDGNKCNEIIGVPWNSYATLSLCKSS